MSEQVKGFAAVAASALIWGLSGLYYKLLADVPPFEITAHRIVWSVIVFGLLFLLRGRLGEVLSTFRQRATLSKLVLATGLISINWAVFIYAVNSGWALEASLGYYIMPLFAVLLAVSWIGERLFRLQMIAVAIAALAVAVLSVGLGVVPWMSLLLAASFATYGLIKRDLEVGPILSILIEVLIASPFAILFLIWCHLGDGAFGRSFWPTILLIGSGPMTAIPLILFTYGSRRLNFATVGLIQYLNPTLQLLVAVLIFGEALTPSHGMALPMIWIALALYSLSAFRDRKTPTMR